MVNNFGQNAGYLGGDVNGDGIVDMSDLLYFISAADAWTNNQQLIGVDLGPPWWLP